MKHLFLDLEDTIITPVVNGWSDTSLINIQFNRDVIEKFKPDFVHLFSFAIHNKTELAGFNRWARPMVERALDVTIDLTPTMNDDIEPRVARALGWHRSTVDFNDIVNLGKQLCFKLFVQDLFKSGGVPIEAWLVDDTVFNETWEWPDLRIKGRIIRV